MSVGLQRLGVPIKHAVRSVCSSKKTYKCKLLVVGAGAGGCSVAWRLSNTLKNGIMVLEPSNVHYYQPAFTLVAAGATKLDKCQKSTYSILPPISWLRDRAEKFDPCNNLVVTKGGDKVYYEFMVVAVGIKNDYDKIPGLKRALDDPTSKVSTIYSPDYCEKTWCLLKQFNGGHSLFTYPKIAGKCAGASLKITFLAHDYWRMHKLLDKTCISYNTAPCTIFSVPKYAATAETLMRKRNIALNYSTDLVEVRPDSAIFLNNCGEKTTFPYNFLHVTPPMSPPVCLSTCKYLADSTGFLNVDHHTLQHKSFPNVFGLGDCTCTPNSKTAAAVAPQSYVVAENLVNMIYGRKPTAKYDGYGACPMLTSYNKGILAETLYDKKLWHTFPFDQTKERRIFYKLCKHVYPRLYWNGLLKGKWNGPKNLRKIINPFGW